MKMVRHDYVGKDVHLQFPGNQGQIYACCPEIFFILQQGRGSLPVGADVITVSFNQFVQFHIFEIILC
jgi:hypothetical protein